MAPTRSASPVTSILSYGSHSDVILYILDFLPQPDVLRVSHTSRALREVALCHPQRYAAVFFPIYNEVEKTLDDNVRAFCGALDAIDTSKTRMSVTVATDAFAETDALEATQTVLNRIKKSMDRIVLLNLDLPADLANSVVDAVQHAPVLRSMRLFIPSSAQPPNSAWRQPVLEFGTLFGAKCDAPQLRHLSIVCEDHGFSVPEGNKLASLPRLESLRLRGNAQRGTWSDNWRRAISHATASIPGIVIELNDAGEEGTDRVEVDLQPLLKGLRGPWHVAMPDTCQVDNYLEVATTDGAFRRRLMWGDCLSSELAGAITKELGDRDFAAKVISMDVEPDYVLDMVDEGHVFPNLQRVTFHSLEFCEPPRTPAALDKQLLRGVYGCTRQDKTAVAEKLFKPGSSSAINFWCPRCGDYTPTAE